MLRTGLISLALVGLAANAWADDPLQGMQVQVPGAEGASPSPTKLPSKESGQGLGVLGVGEARDDAFVLARAIYASRLRPSSLDEKRARILAGEAPTEDAPGPLKELAELRAGVKGDDAASRTLLAGMARDLGLAGILVVTREPVTPSADAEAPAASPLARLYLAESNDFDAARYAPTSSVAGAAAWRPVVTSLERRFPTTKPQAAGLTSPAPSTPVRASESGGKPFYASPWFWGALGAAALLGTGVYFATRNPDSDSINLQLRVP